MAKLHLTSLGCPKNRVDAEHMLGIARSMGHELVANAEEADTLLVNTCAFINDAKEESIDAILAMAKLKENSQGEKKLLVSGCLAQRYAKDLEAEIPEIDHFLGTSDYAKIGSILGNAQVQKGKPELVLLKKKEKNLVSTELDYLEKFDLPRINSLPSFSAYLRVSEGCDNKCAFCIIPKLRGLQRSRGIEDLVKETEFLAKSGAKEINLIAQDLTAYGHDIAGRPSLAHLLDALASVSGIRWIRQLYAYPRSFSDEYFKVFQHKNILPYIDMPVQHGSEKVLRDMKRGGSKARLTSIINSLRENISGLVLRTTVIVGFPGENEDDFKQLCDFVAENKFDRLGVFQYSNEENTTAFDFANQVPKEIMARRYRELMELQREISREKMHAMIGTVQEALVEGQSDEHELLVKGRLWSQAPEIDGHLYISSEKTLNVGDFVSVRVNEAHDYDVAGEVILSH